MEKLEELYLASAVRALWGSISKNLKAVTLDFYPDQHTYTWNSYFFDVPTEDEVEALSVSNTEFLSDLPSSLFTGTDEQVFIGIEPMMTELTLLVYKSYDPCFVKRVPTGQKVNFGSVLRCGLQSLNGSVTENLKSVYVYFPIPYDHVTWHAVFDSLPSEEEWRMQIQAARLFASAFNTKPFYKMVLAQENNLIHGCDCIFKRYEEGMYDS